VTELEMAEKIARLAHTNQHEESTGDPYIRHIERVVERVTARHHDPGAPIVAWLHDVVEDSEWTVDDLRLNGISEPVITAVVLLTRVPGQTYATHIDAIKESKNPLAIAVKIADLYDHLRPNCPARLLSRYEKAWVTLTGKPWKES